MLRGEILYVFSQPCKFLLGKIRLVLDLRLDLGRLVVLGSFQILLSCPEGELLVIRLGFTQHDSLAVQCLLVPCGFRSHRGS